MTATDWLKCFCTYKLKCSKAMWIYVDGYGMDWMEISVSTSSMSTALRC